MYQNMLSDSEDESIQEDQIEIPKNGEQCEEKR